MDLATGADDEADDETGDRAGGDGGDESEEPAGVRRVRLSRRQLLALSGGLAACAVGGVAGGAWGRATAPGPGTALDKILGRDVRTTNNHRRIDADPEAIFGVSTTERVVALTFDDGPDTRYTSTVLDLLHDRGVHASFFAVGANAVAHPDLLLAARDAGHSIGNHTRNHRPLDQLPPAQAYAEILGGLTDLEGAGVPDVDLFRPPFGMTEEVIGAFASGAGLRSVFWSSCVENVLAGRSPQEAARWIVDDVRPGDIILAHDGSGWLSQPEHRRTRRERTVAALPHLLDGLADRGFDVVDVTRLLDSGAPRRGDDPDL